MENRPRIELTMRRGSTVRLTLSATSNYSRHVIRKRLTSPVLAIFMLTAAMGVGAHQQEGTCPMSKLPDCCKKAQSNGPAASLARLCCNLNCSEPGSTGNSSASTRSTHGAMNAVVVLAGAAFSSKIEFTPRLQQFRPHDSSPRYIKHLALLI